MTCEVPPDWTSGACPRSNLGGGCLDTPNPSGRPNVRAAAKRLETSDPPATGFEGTVHLREPRDFHPGRLDLRGSQGNQIDDVDGHRRAPDRVGEKETLRLGILSNLPREAGDRDRSLGCETGRDRPALFFAAQLQPSTAGTQEIRLLGAGRLHGNERGLTTSASERRNSCCHGLTLSVRCEDRVKCQNTPSVSMCYLTWRDALILRRRRPSNRNAKVTRFRLRIREAKREKWEGI